MLRALRRLVKSPFTRLFGRCVMVMIPVLISGIDDILAFA
jgi:hypothetical protein